MVGGRGGRGLLQPGAGLVLDLGVGQECNNSVPIPGHIYTWILPACPQASTPPTPPLRGAFLTLVSQLGKRVKSG